MWNAAVVYHVILLSAWSICFLTPSTIKAQTMDTASVLVEPGDALWLGDYTTADPITPDYHDYLPLSYVIYGPEAVAFLRVIVEPDDDCPDIVSSEDGTNVTADMPNVTIRAVGDYTMPNPFPIKVCEAKLSTQEQKDAWTTQAWQWSGINTTIPLASNPQRYVLVADTGLRSESKDLGLGKCTSGPTLYDVHQCPINFTESDLNFSKISGSFQSFDEWPAVELFAKEADLAPDVVVFAGDYLYRQSPCPLIDGVDCYGINGPPFVNDSDLNGTVANFLPGLWGDTFWGWWADLFYPALPLLSSTPFIAARGNHEMCGRGGQGFFLLLAPTEYQGKAGDYCEPFISPYAVPFENEQFLVLDSASLPDTSTLYVPDAVCPGAPSDGTRITAQLLDLYDPDPYLFSVKDPTDTNITELIAQYTSYWEMIKDMSQSHDTNFLLTHRPIMSLTCSNATMVTSDWTLQSSLEADTLDRISAFITGHIHLVNVVEFENQSLPTQILVGHGGTRLDSTGTNATVFPYMDIAVGHDSVVRGSVIRGTISNHTNGFAIMERLSTGEYNVSFTSYNASTDEFFNYDFPLTVPQGPRVQSLSSSNNGTASSSSDNGTASSSSDIKTASPSSANGPASLNKPATTSAALCEKSILSVWSLVLLLLISYIL